MIDLAEFGRDFRNRFGSSPEIVRAPGRVNLIGEHTDYNDGYVLPFAIDRQTYVGFAPRSDGTLNVYSRTLDAELQLPVDSAERGKGWELYIRGMVEVLRRRGMRFGGADLMIDSEIPFGSGLSSSAALEISLGLALSKLGERPIDLVDLAFAGQEVEHEFLGLRSGIMDQFTSALAKRGNALLIDCRNLDYQHIPLPLNEHSILVCNTKVTHELADSAYNERRAECEEGAELLSRRYRNVTALRDISIDQLNESSDCLPPTIFKRCRHVVTENYRTLESAEALAMSDLNRLGTLMYQSHQSLKVDYEVTCAELDWLVDNAKESGKALGARMTGGGFGGCTINIVPREFADELAAKLTSGFQEEFGHAPDLFDVSPCEGAGDVDPH